jgi:hypothetical protein
MGETDEGGEDGDAAVVIWMLLEYHFTGCEKYEN